MEGWIKLHRKLFDNPIVSQDAEYLAVWIYLLSHATHSEYEADFGGSKITLKAGQLITGRKVIAARLNISESKVYRILAKYKIEHQIEMISNNKASLVTIVNWAFYQVSESEVNNKRTANRTANEHIQECYKNVNNKKYNARANRFNQFQRIDYGDIEALERDLLEN